MASRSVAEELPLVSLIGRRREGLRKEASRLAKTWRHYTPVPEPHKTKAYMDDGRFCCSVRVGGEGRGCALPVPVACEGFLQWKIRGKQPEHKKSAASTARALWADRGVAAR